jgi:hypothetical protein
MGPGMYGAGLLGGGVGAGLGLGDGVGLRIFQH